MPTRIEDITVLLVDSQNTMRSQLRNMLGMCGITRVAMAASAGSAVRKLHEAAFDIILCEYHLGEGQDGQHLLEDIRHHHLVPLSTLFVMITGESAYERVVGAAELAPNDYILKPFTMDRLRERLERALNKREAFLSVYGAIEAGNTLDAIAGCEAGELHYPAYAIDFLRLRAELLTSIGRADEAKAVYEQVLARRAVPWAKLGLAKTHYLARRHDEAEQILNGLIAENREYLDAYDWLARTQEARGHLNEARESLQKAAQLSPHVLHRLRRIGEVDLELGDADHAERTLAEVVRKGKYSDFRDPEDHVRLVRAQLGTGATDRAAATLRDLERSMQGLPKTELCRAVSSAMVWTQQGDTERAAQAAERAASLLDPRLGASPELKKSIARVCLDNRLEGQASEVIMDMLRHAADDGAVESVKRMLTGLGHERLGETLATQMRTEVRAMMTEGAQLAETGDYDGAVKHFMAAARKLPGNTLVLFNAALALLKYIEHCGWDDHYAEHARGLIERLRAQDPGNPKLGPLHAYFDGLLKRYGVRAERA